LQGRYPWLPQARQRSRRTTRGTCKNLMHRRNSNGPTGCTVFEFRAFYIPKK
jgi:hypothetical protein